MNLPTPKEHPQATTVLSTATIAALLVSEVKNRLGVDITNEESYMIVIGFSTLYFMLLGKAKKDV